VLKEYRPVVLRALGWIGQQQVNDRRDLKKDGELPGGMYAHALGTMALCEGYALSKDERMKIATQKAVKFLVQSPLVEKGWRSDSQQPASASVVAEAIMALRSAQAASMPVSKDTLTKAGAFLDSCAAGPEDARMSRYSHQPGESADLTATAAGLLCRQYLGWGRDETDLVAGCNYLLENLPPEFGTELGPIHYYFYATQVLHHREGEQWDKWNHSVREHLLRSQQKDGPQEGSWTSSDADSGKDGRIFATSMALLTLETYYRQLPVYKRTMKIADTK
jgi:hypothetical protein